MLGPLVNLDHCQTLDGEVEEIEGNLLQPNGSGVAPFLHWSLGACPIPAIMNNNNRLRMRLRTTEVLEEQGIVKLNGGWK